MTSFWLRQRLGRHPNLKRRNQRNNAMREMRASVKRLKQEMEEISEDQRCIKEGQRQVREKFEAIEYECEQLKRETQVIMQQSARTQLRLNVMFRILKSREQGDFAMAEDLTRLLRELVARENLERLASRNGG